MLYGEDLAADRGVIGLRHRLAHLVHEVCCIYQNCHKFTDIEQWKNIKSIRETFCDYPNVAADDIYAKAIRELSYAIYFIEEEPEQ